MAVEYKDITQLEKLDSLAEGSYIMVVEDGTAKLISKENAKFGDGITTFYLSVESVPGGNAAVVIVVHEDGTKVSPQEAYDAYMSGPVRLCKVYSNPVYYSDVLSMSSADSYGNENPRNPEDIAEVYFIFADYDMWELQAVTIGHAEKRVK